MKAQLRKLMSGQIVKLIESILDLGVILGALFIYAIFSHYQLNGSMPNIFDKFVENVLRFRAYFPYVLLVLFILHIYKPSIFTRSYLSIMKSIIVSLIMVNMLLILVTFFYQVEMAFTPLDILAILVLQIFIFSIYKFITYQMFSKLIKRRVMIIGPKAEALDLAMEFHLDSDHSKVISTIYYETDGIVSETVYNSIYTVEEVYLTPGLSDKNKYGIMQFTIAKAFKNIYLVPKTYEISFMNAKDDSIDDTLLLHIPTLGMSIEQRFFKRLLDFILSSIALILLSPIFIIIAILIKLEDGGPVFYKQTRCKRKNETFKVIKFRTMVVNQPKDQLNKRPSKNDKRITKVGRILRVTRLDELAQLFNIFIGQMSLVGPRPLILEEVEAASKEIPEFYYRSNVKPGLTGLAQIKSKYDTEAKEKIRYDLLYVAKYSFWLDIKIMILTVKAILSPGSITQESNGKTFYDYLKDKKIQYTESDIGLTIH